MSKCYILRSFCKLFANFIDRVVALIALVLLVGFCTSPIWLSIILMRYAGVTWAAIGWIEGVSIGSCLLFAGIKFIYDLGEQYIEEDSEGVKR